MTATGNEAVTIAQAAKALDVDAQNSGATGDEPVRLRQLKMVRDSLVSFETSQISITYPGQNSATFYYTDKDGVYNEKVNPSKIEVVSGSVFSVYVYPSNPFEGNGGTTIIITNIEKITSLNRRAGSGSEELYVCRTTGSSATILI